jgi:hypothetical protein
MESYKNSELVHNGDLGLMETDNLITEQSKQGSEDE